ncbi:hypothetical protein AFL01nite_10240 [Aeromicrobium flavum]|uniref:Uncharacterized protein n=1 Tax=Aeromicrobium flavum TaxID=416568 RepID=A0A512HTC4_9ACTN|nr:DUF6270 domain-containing protein [Aeromicrobium flavum]GEO88697.1 hypothetical protein AFL01nite_10240 [Aeromicrobium flavum]
MRVMILGSCVTRDAFECQQKPWPIELEEYFARSALASAMDPRPFTGVDLSRIGSAFQRKVVEFDLTDAFPRALEEGRYDLLVYDLIDERFDVVQNAEGALATRSSEFNSSGYDASADEVVRTATPAAFALWEQGWTALVERLSALGRLDDLRINRAYWASEVEGGGEFPPVFTPERIATANAYLDRLYERAAKDIGPEGFYEFTDRELLAAGEHRWGVSPFHYTNAYNDRLLELMGAHGAR